MRTIHIIAAHNNARKLEAHAIRIDVHFGRGLRRRIRVRGFQKRVFREVWPVVLAVHLVRGDVDKELDRQLDRGLKHDVRALDIRLGELEGVPKAEIHVRLRGKVEDRVDGVVFDAPHHGLEVRDVAVDELEVRAAIQAVRVVQCGAVVDLVEGDDPIAGVVEY